jgi:hypothetical protein
VLVVMFCQASFCLELAGQSSQAFSGDSGAKDQQAANLPVVKGTFRPNPSLQDALKIAEGYIRKQHIDMSSYRLYRGVLILYGDNNTAAQDKTPCWHLWWVKDTAAMGDYVEILVDMDGKAWRVPSM